MQPWLRRTFVGAFGASALLGGVAACTSYHHGPHGWHAANDEDHGKFKARLLDKAAGKLDLDATQKAKLAVLLDRLDEQRRALHGPKDPRQEVLALIDDNTFDRWHAHDLVNARMNAVREKSPQVITAMAEFYDSLKPEQQAKVRDFVKRAGPHWRHHG